MSKASIRSGIEVPFTLARDAMFVLHGRDEKDVLGIYVGNKADEPVCIHNLGVVFYDRDHYSIQPHDKFIHFSEGPSSVYLPDRNKINNGHELRIYSPQPEDLIVYDHFGAGKVLHIGPYQIHLMYRAPVKSWIEL